MKLSGLNIFREYAKNFKLNLVLVVVFVSESKAHLYRLYFEAIQFFHSFWWNKLYNHLLDDHASHDKKTTNETGSKFITPDIRKAMREGDRLKKKFNKSRNPEDWLVVEE